jgi:hypothetical protein
MLQSKFMILLLQHHPGSSTSISSSSPQPLISLSSSLFRDPIPWIIFNHLPPFLCLTHTQTTNQAPYFEQEWHMHSLFCPDYGLHWVQSTPRCSYCLIPTTTRTCISIPHC